MRLRLAFAVTCLLFFGAVRSGAPTIEMDPTWTRVGLAKVKLQVRDLLLSGNRVVGTYRIVVPLAPLMNDRGEISLESDQPVERVMSEGGRLYGSGHSTEDGKTVPIVCEFLGDGTVNIVVETGKRVLEFKTRHRISG